MGGQPPRKKTRTEDESTDSVSAPTSSQSKPAKYVGKFNEKWRYTVSGEARTWLEYRAKEGMICTVCRSHSKDKRNSFIVGCPTVKLESITFHESSKSHRDSMTISQAQPIQATPTVHGLAKLPRATKRKLEILFCNAHPIAKQARVCCST